MDKTMAKEEWLAKGRSLFGDNMLQWKFRCPGCGHVQMPEEFRQYKDKGATPDSARCECIGRYSGGKSWTDAAQSTPGPCDYAGYGLLNICPVGVVDGDKTIYAFDFAVDKEVAHSSPA